MTQHVLAVDGYCTSEERMFEGVMFQVHITETPGDLTITDVTNLDADANYLAKFRMEPFREEVRKHVQENIDYLKQYAASQGKTVNDLMDEQEEEEPTWLRIEILNEV